MANLFNTLNFDKDPSELTKSDLRVIIKRLEGKLGAASNGGTVVGGTGAIELDLEKAREMLKNFGNPPRVDWKAAAAETVEGTVKEATDKVATTVVKETAGEATEAAAKTVIKGEAGLTKAFKFGRTAGMIGMAAVGVAGVADLVMNSGERSRAREQQREQRENQKRKDKTSRQYNYSGSGYQPETFDSFVQQMFNQRTGHTYMGNAKFR